MTETSLEIQPLKTHAEYVLVEKISKKAWSLSNYREVIPAHLMITFQQSGGLVLGAFLDKKMVGFSIGFIGLTAGGQIKFCSEQLGVLPDYQSQNIGYRLKLAQRESMLARQIDHITWTFDPLETKNGNLNLHKLGCRCRTYLPNVYGDGKGINAGVPTDRFMVDWWLKDPGVSNRLAGIYSLTLSELRQGGVPVLNEELTDIVQTAAELPEIQPESEQLLVKVPADFQKIKLESSAQAKAWRTLTRHIFTNLFDKGYVASDLFMAKPDCFYLLEMDYRAV